MVEERKALQRAKIAKSFQKLLIQEYLKIEVLSRSGGFSTVLKGTRIGLNREEAIKAINLDSIEDSGLTTEKIEQEMNILAKLDHINIVKIYNRIRKTTVEKDYMFVIMELCTSTLADTIALNPQGISVGKAREYLKEIIEGVEYLHSQNIIHRDLKPENIFLKGEHVKIGDFNISKEVGVGTTTKPSQMLLTLGYAPPERVILRQPGDFRVDLWSIGVIYYQLLHGFIPFTGDTYEELLTNIEEIRYPEITKGNEFDRKIIQMTLVNERKRCDINELSDFIRGGGESLGKMEEIKTRMGVPKGKMIRAPDNQEPGNEYTKVENKKLSNGAIYTGERRNGLNDGQGIQIWADGAKYEGEWKKGKAEGRGKFIHINGDVYMGEWVDDKAKGYGEFIHNNGDRYRGEWLNDFQHGYGEETWADGSRYKGHYSEGKKEGKGKYQWIDNSIFEGDWANNKITGIGIYKWADGRSYSGSWLENNMHGNGIYKWADGRSYEGEYYMDKKHGAGIYKWADGRKYEGEWADGKQHGKGTYFLAEGIVKKGIWEKGKRIKWEQDKLIVLSYTNLYPINI